MISASSRAYIDRRRPTNRIAAARFCRCDRAYIDLSPQLYKTTQIELAGMWDFAWHHVAAKKTKPGYEARLLQACGVMQAALGCRYSILADWWFDAE